MSLIRLPKQWMEVALDDVVDKIVGGGTPSKTVPSYYQGNIPWMTVKDMNKFVLTDTVDHISEEAVENSATNIIPAGTPIIATRMSLGKLVRANFDSAINQDLKAIFVNENVSKIYFEYWYRSISHRIQEMGTGTTVKGIRLEDIKQLSFALAPLAEQQQIAQKLDELLAQVDTLKTRLDAIPNILKRFRQSVLAAAVSGRLTEEWRGENNAPIWRNLALGEITAFQNGFAFKSEWFSGAGDFQVLKLGNVKNGELRLDASPAFVDKNVAELYEKYKPDYEDILITMTGTKYKRDYGFTCLVPKNSQTLINQRVGRIIADKNLVVPGYLLIFLQSKIFLDEFFKGETGGVNQGNVGSEHIKSCIVSLPTIEEQTEIVRRVEQLFAYADQIEQRVKDAQARVNHLTQSILAKAFRGELTADWRAQNPELISGENSAEKLLERIKAEREKVGKVKRKAKA